MPAVAAGLPLLCPRCRDPLREAGEGLECACGTPHPVILGIPDLRVCRDPYIDPEADREKGRRLDREGRGLGFAELVALYFRLTPEVPAGLAQRFARHQVAGEARGEAVLARMASYGLWPPSRVARILDLGCGTAGLLALCARSGHAVVGVDIAFRWLAVARRHLEERGVSGPRLLCACADHLPFPDGSFDLVVAENLLEHVRDPAPVLREARRVAAPGAHLVARSVNRFALAPDPHVGLLCLGFLPRRLAKEYVRLRRRTTYEMRSPSLSELRRTLARSGWLPVHVGAARVTDPELALQPEGRRRLMRLYRRIERGLPWLRPALGVVGPYLDVVATAADPRGAGYR